MDSKAEWSA